MVPLCPSRGLPAPGFSCPGGPGVRGSGQGLPSPCSLPTQPSGRRGTSFLGIFPKAYTRHVRRPTPASSLVQKHSFAPKPKPPPGHLSQHRSRVQSQPGPSGTAVPTPLGAPSYAVGPLLDTLTSSNGAQGRTWGSLYRADLQLAVPTTASSCQPQERERFLRGGRAQTKGPETDRLPGEKGDTEKRGARVKLAGQGKHPNFLTARSPPVSPTPACPCAPGLLVV